MYDTLSTPAARSMRQLSGEELLLLAVLGSESLKPGIDRELDRRAHADGTGHYRVAPRHPAPFSGFAA